MRFLRKVWQVQLASVRLTVCKMFLSSSTMYIYVYTEWPKKLYTLYSSIYIFIYFIFSCNWVDTRWQQYSSHLHTNSTPNTKNGTYITITKLNTHNNKILTSLWSAGRAPSLGVIPWHLPYNWGKSTEKPQLG